MKAYRIVLSDSEFPYLVIAESLSDAERKMSSRIGCLEGEYPDIYEVTQLQEYLEHNIVV